MHESIREQKISTVVIFASSPRQSQISWQVSWPAEPCPEHSAGHATRSLAQLSVRGACSTDLHEARRGGLTAAGNLLQSLKYSLKQTQVRVTL
jgi:hypothetical protein